MASCPKCGARIQRRHGRARCSHCGPLPVRSNEEGIVKIGFDMWVAMLFMLAVVGFVVAALSGAFTP